LSSFWKTLPLLRTVFRGQWLLSVPAESEEGERSDGSVMKLKRYNKEGISPGDRDRDIPLFEEDRGIAALRFAIEAMQANKRQENASTKKRGDVRDGGKKPFRQKGTGHARQGLI
jgi:hypothetical protein